MKIGHEFKTLTFGVIALAATISVPAIGGFHGPDGYPANGVYRIGERDIKLEDGRYSSIDGTVAVAGVERGDIDADGNEDLLVVLVENSRGSGVFYYVSLLLGHGESGYGFAGSAFLGDRVSIDDVSIDGDRSLAIVALKMHGDEQPYAAPPEHAVTRRWQVAAGVLAETDARVEHAQQLLMPFKKQLKAALIEGLADGPDAAIDACKVKAPQIAAGLSTDGVVVGRTSHRLRNPANRSPDWVSPVLDHYLEAPASRDARVVELGDGRFGYVEPIALQPMCVMCHGKTLAPDVAERIAALYPDDEATGFDVGDLRGVFWLEFPSR